MPISEMIEYQKRASEEEAIKLQLAIHCAPVLKGVKISNILTVNTDSFGLVENILANTKLSYRFLKVIDYRAILIIYRKERLKGYLSTNEISAFLKSLGYTEELEEMFNLLSSRIQYAEKKSTSFPHEIGLFLGYPLSDVMGFLKQGEKECLYVGYWRVYNHVNSKIRLFQRYDRVREDVVRDILDGKSIEEIAV